MGGSNGIEIKGCPFSSHALSLNKKNSPLPAFFDSILNEEEYKHLESSLREKISKEITNEEETKLCESYEKKFADMFISKIQRINKKALFDNTQRKELLINEGEKILYSDKSKEKLEKVKKELDKKTTELIRMKADKADIYNTNIVLLTKIKKLEKSIEEYSEKIREEEEKYNRDFEKYKKEKEFNLKEIETCSNKGKKIDHELKTQRIKHYKEIEEKENKYNKLNDELTKYLEENRNNMELVADVREGNDKDDLSMKNIEDWNEIKQVIKEQIHEGKESTSKTNVKIMKYEQNLEQFTPENLKLLEDYLYSINKVQC